jgi:hypothetical protein
MGIGNDQVTVTTSATPIITDDSDGQYVRIRNMSSSRSVFLGTSSVTISNGYELVKDSSIEMSLGPGEEIYGIVEEDTQPVCWIATMNE